MKVIHKYGLLWREQSDYSGFIIYYRWDSALFLSNRMLLKMKALGSDVEYTSYSKLRPYLIRRKK